MKVFVAGATGVLGRALVPQLVERGHEVVGMTRSASKQDLVRRLGARPVVADALDPDAVAQALAAAEPEVIVHELTAFSEPTRLREARRPDRSVAFRMTNRLRTEATDHLVAAGRAVGARRFVAQSFGAFRFAPAGGPVCTEAEPLDPNDPPAPLRAVQAAYVYLEQAVTGIEWGEGLVLRYGGFYGPGTSTSLASDALMAALIRRRRFPIIGDGGGVCSHVHVEDAAVATAMAVERGVGVYNIVDDEPAPVREWLPVLASTLGAKPPRRIPRWLGRLLAGEAATAMMTEARGASNEKAKRELGWQPRYASWRQGFAQGLSASHSDTDAAGSLEPLRHTKTIALATFRRDGTQVVTPVSVAFEGDRAFFRTWHKTWKTRRLAHTPDVEVAPSDFRGRATGPPIRARATLLGGEDARVAAGALARRHRVLRAVLVPLTHRLMRYRTMHYELVAAAGGRGRRADG